MNTGALARFLHDAGVVDYRPTTTGGDAFIGLVPSSPDSLVAIVSLGGDVDPTTGESITDFQIVVRGERNDATGPAARANNVSAALKVLADAVPVTIAAGSDDEVSALMVTVNAPANSGLDDLSRTEWIVRVTVRSAPASAGLPSASLLETKAGAQAKANAAEAAGVAAVAGHAGDTTDVHGITDTSVLETQSGAQSKADAAQSAAEQTAASDATSKVDAHASDTTNIHGIADTALLETQSGAQAKVDAHASDTTDVHGIADTSVLETQAGAQSKADAAQSAAEQTAASDATSKVDAHASDTTNVHGIADTSLLETQAGAQSKADAAQTAAEQTAAATYLPAADRGAVDGVASLDNAGKVPTSQLPALAITESHVVADEAAMLALDAQTGDIAIRTDTSTSFILSEAPASNIGNWNELLSPPNEVVSVDGRVGAVDLSDRYAPASHTDATTNVHGITDTSLLETQAGAQSKADAAQSAAEQTAASDATSKVDAHASDTTDVHGITDTSLLETQAGAQAKADAAQTAAEQTAAATYIPATEKAQPDGVATLDANGVVPENQLPPLDYVPTAEKGAADGVATLDANGVVPESQLPEIDSGPAFLGDWQAGEYQPGQLVADNGYLMTPRVVTSASPYIANPFSGNVTNPDWIRVHSSANPGGDPDLWIPGVTSLGMPFLRRPEYGESPDWNDFGWLDHDYVLSDIDGLSIELTAAVIPYQSWTNELGRLRVGFYPAIQSIPGTPPDSRNFWFEWNRKDNDGTVRAANGTRSFGSTYDTLGPENLGEVIWRVEFARSNGDIIGTVMENDNVLGSTTFTEPYLSQPAGYKVFLGGNSGSGGASLAIGDVTVSTGAPLLSPDWRRLANLVDES